MLVNFERRICYLAHAKTASRATSQVLKERCGFVAVTDHHEGWDAPLIDNGVFPITEWTWHNQATFLYLMTIRNPWDVIASWYVDSANHIRHDRIGPEWFEAFRELHPKLFPETDLWPFLENEPPGVVGVMKYEVLQGDLKVFSEVLRFPVIRLLPVIGMTAGREPYRTYYDDESREWVANTFPNAIKAGGYYF